VGGQILRQWYKVVLRLVRHTATYSPPVASRAFAYFGVAAYQAVASGSTSLVSLAGQLNGLKALPPRDPAKRYSDAVITHCVMASAVKTFFGNTGPTGQRVMAAAEKKLKGDATRGLSADVVEASLAYGEALKAAIIDWSMDDGGAVIENMGFPMAYDVSKEPGRWVPTSAIRQQQFDNVGMAGAGCKHQWRLAVGRVGRVDIGAMFDQCTDNAGDAHSRGTHQHAFAARFQCVGVRAGFQ
jgi:hypothetical protein